MKWHIPMRSLRRMGGILILTATVSALSISAASAAGPNVLKNGDFESVPGLTGWTALRSTLSIVPGVTGNAARATYASGTDYGLRATARPVTGGVAGMQYTGDGMVRSDTPGKKVCIYLTEYSSGGGQIGQSKACTTTTANWTPLNAATRSLAGSGGSLAFAVRQSAAAAGESFDVDNLSLVQEAGTTPVAPGLWHMDETETSGPMLDSGTAPANNGTLAGTIRRGDPGTPEIPGTAYFFTRGWVTVPHDVSLNPGTAKVTVTAHINPVSLPSSGDYDIIRKGDYPAQLYKVELLRTGALSCAFRGSSGANAAISTNTISPNTGFHTIQCIKTAGQVQAVVDGVTTSKNANIGSISSTAPVVIGAHTGGTSGFFKGSIDEVSVTFG
jgi:concanavalin A-like lectin/glucanase superfamily protein